MNYAFKGCSEKKSLRGNLTKIRKYVSGERMLITTREVSNFHRIQASTGYRKAAYHCVEKLKSEGFNTHINSYPADGKTWHLTAKTFQEWHIENAFCDLVFPEFQKLADFRGNNISIIQKSYPCDFRENPVEVVLMDKGSKEEAYEGIDLKGKILFVREPFKNYMEWAIKKAGALGFITDYMLEVEPVRHRYDMLDIRNYTSFWWKHTADEPKTFGFVLTPRLGDQMADLCKKMELEHSVDSDKPRYPKVSCFIDSKLYPGEIEVVETTLPGESTEEILVIAHLCHPRSSANDNASGIAAGMELLRTIRDLTETGELLPLKRTLRMIFVPEFSGTYAFLKDMGNKRSNLLAGINLDMVGGKQGKEYGPIALTGLPHAAPSFVFHLGELVVDEIKKELVGPENETEISVFNCRTGVFEAGSDHYILSDPTVGIPTLMLGQWPDKNYHTSRDTMDSIDPFVLEKSASIAAGYIYTLLNLEEEQIPGILNRTLQSFMKDLTSILEESMEMEKGISELTVEFNHYIQVYEASIKDLLRFFKSGSLSEKAKASIAEELVFIKQLGKQLLEHHVKTAFIGIDDMKIAEEDIRDGLKLIPERNYVGPITNIDDFALLEEAKMKQFVRYEKEFRKNLKDPHRTEALIQFYINGKRTIEEIEKAVEIETKESSLEKVVFEYIQLLKSFGLINKME